MGVRHAIISPGSRSTPLVLAAATHEGFQKQVVLDERSAGYQALGIGKATGIPALLICTSGTALANYHPAIIESKESGVPVIVLSADRPPYLRGTGSSQTIDQIKIFGDSVVMFHESGEPVHQQKDYERLELLAKQAVSTSIIKAGTVHLNFPFRKPLEPVEGSVMSAVNAGNQQLKISENSIDPVFASERTIVPDKQLVNLINRSKKPLIIAGPDERNRALESIAEYCSNKLNIPVIAEPGSFLPASINFLSKYEIYLRNFRLVDSLKPDLIIRTGDQPFSKALLDFVSKLRNQPVLQFLSRDTWQDSYNSVNHRIVLHNSQLELDSVEPKAKEWKDRWSLLEKKSSTFVDITLKKSKSLTDGHVFHHFSKILLSNWNQISSNSFTIRDLSLFGAPNNSYKNLFVNRGAAGIDGIISTGIGISVASQKKLAVFTGDLAFLHDTNSLLSLKNLNHPFLIIIINNRGGNIFRMLPINSYKQYYKDYFETPQKIDISYLAKANGLKYVQVETLNKLYSIKEDMLSGSKPVILDCKTDPDESMYIRHKLWNSEIN